MPHRKPHSKPRRLARIAMVGAVAVAAAAALPTAAGAAPDVGTPVDTTLAPLQSSTLVPRKPDLVITRADQYSFTVKNSGFATAGQSWATVSSAGTHYVPSLAAGASQTVPIVACDLDSWGTMVIRVDAYLQVNELSESNNSTSVTPLC
jgi:CARDB protein